MNVILVNVIGLIVVFRIISNLLTLVGLLRRMKGDVINGESVMFSLKLRVISSRKGPMGIPDKVS